MSGVLSRKFAKAIPWILLGIAFVLFGVWVRHQMPFSIWCRRDTEIYSFDFLGYAYTLSDFRFIGYGRFRHPLWGWLTAPVTLFGHHLLAIGEMHYWIFLLVVFAAVGVASAALLRHLTIRHCGLSPLEATSVVCLHCSFAHVWLLAGMPETFGVSMLLALATLNWALGSEARRQSGSMTVLGEVVKAPKLGARIDLAGWAALAVLTGGVTVTQAAKTAIAYALTHRQWFRRLLRASLAFGAAAMLVVAVFYLRVLVRTCADPSAPGMSAAWHSIVDHIAPMSISLSERFRLVWIFFSEPLTLRGENFDVRVISGGYDNLLQPALLAFLYALVALSAWWNRKTLVVKIVSASFLVDVIIHFVIGWGLPEAQLYGGHWMYAVPIFVGLLFPHLRRPLRRAAPCIVLLLAALFLLCNWHGYFNHAVGVAAETDQRPTALR